MADMNGSANWFITYARQAYDEGHRVIAGGLNQVLAEVAPEVRIAADPMRSSDSLPHAVEKFRAALPAMRVYASLPSLDSRILLWTYGYLNDSENEQVFVKAGDPTLIDGVESICKLLRYQRPSWRVEDWRKLIQEPVEKQRRQWHQFLSNMEGGKKTTDNPKKVSVKYPDNQDVLGLCMWLAQRSDQIERQEVTLIGIAREYALKSFNDEAQAANLLRQAQRFPHLWKMPCQR